MASAKFERQTALSFALTLFCGGDREAVVVRRILRGFVEAVGFGERDEEHCLLWIRCQKIRELNWHALGLLSVVRLD